MSELQFPHPAPTRPEPEREPVRNVIRSEHESRPESASGAIPDNTHTLGVCSPEGRAALCRVCLEPAAADSRYCSGACAQVERDCLWALVKSRELRDGPAYRWAREELGLVEREEYHGQAATLEALLRIMPAHIWRFQPEVCATCGAAPVGRFPDGSPRYGCYDPATHKPIYPGPEATA